VIENRINQVVFKAVRKLQVIHGFVVNPNRPKWIHKLDALRWMQSSRYFHRIQQMRFHDLCTTLTPPPNLGSLLGLGDKFCIEQGTPHPDWQSSIHRFRRSIRLRHQFEHHEEKEAFNPKMYIPSDYQPKTVADGPIESQMLSFAHQIESASNRHIKALRPKFNLSKHQHSLLTTLKEDDRFVVALSDKNLGPVVIERKIYIQRVFDDHLTKGNTYTRLTEGAALLSMSQCKLAMIRLFQEHKSRLPPDTVIYFDRGLKQDHRIPLFYVLFKIHKDPWMTRPVVSCCGSFLNLFSKWLDDQMKRLLPLAITYLKDSFQVLKEADDLGRLPTNAHLFSADAIGMYNFIMWPHAEEVFRTWFSDYADEIPSGFNVEFFMSCLKMVMTNNIFSFGDTFWLQNSGTAMGTSCACLYATLYCALHERQTVLPQFGSSLLYFKRFIDDVIGVWIGSDDDWKLFQTSLNFGALKWTFTPLSQTVDFLDLTLTIDPTTRRIHTKTFQKPMNLYLYLPPNSAHPPGVLRSTVYGCLRRYWFQNSRVADFQAIVRAFARRLVARGHNREVINGLLIRSAQRLDLAPRGPRPPCQTVHTATVSALFFHQEFHPRGLPRESIRRAYDTLCAKHSGFDKLILAYKRPKNLRDALIPSRLQGLPPASEFLPPT
jgi:hypothetical protein